ncbi:MAG TPA: HlyD family efflux transporter periplasmic adaptor subunit [Casimicrobiaceae bacterium]|nr:HlyD family efflux transporter periplasmic adaptor subunit [Casimicrobiaceae bacterium]
MNARLAALACVVAIGGCAERTPAGYPGYVEGEYVRVAAPLSGTLLQLTVERGAEVARDAPLFTLESEQERAARAEAESRVRQAQAALANLEKGRRPPEIAAVRAQLAQAQASLRQSEADLVRTQKLVADKFLPPQKRDESIATRDRDRARVAELSQQVQIANLPARSDEIAAANAEVKAATDALAQAQWRVAQKSQVAPAAGLVIDTLYRVGEWVPAGASVVSLLPPANVKIRFYVPEPIVGTLRIGDAVDVRCDGCGAPINAKIRFIAPQAEFTPPVIYSKENRASLVFLVEARPDAFNAALHPGLPVDVAVPTRAK